MRLEMIEPTLFGILLHQLPHSYFSHRFLIATTTTTSKRRKDGLAEDRTGGYPVHNKLIGRLGKMRFSILNIGLALEMNQIILASRFDLSDRKTCRFTGTGAT